jgi:hypothetical protein
MLLDALAAWKFLLSGKPSHFIAILKAHLSFYSLAPRFIKKRENHTKYLLQSNKFYCLDVFHQKKN